MFEWALLLYLILCGIIIGIRHHRDKREWWIRFVLVASLPIIGFLMPAFWSKRWHDINASKNRLAELDMFSQANILAINQFSVFTKPEAEKEMNVVPLEEALLVNDLSTRRRVIIDLLKQDSIGYLEVLRMAVSNEDTETSHYAVSAIMEVKRKLTLMLQEFAVQYEENKDDPHLLRSYADVLKSYMRSGFLDERTMVKHNHLYSTLLDRLLEIAPESTDAYIEKINADLDLGNYMDAERTALIYREKYPRSEDAYLCLLKIYYTLRAVDKLMRTIEELKSTPIRLSSRALTAIKFWSKGDQDEYESSTKT